MSYLKAYQQECVDRVTGYFRRVRELGDANTAFYEATRQSYHEPRGLEGLPYVCLKVPTGGGKTAVAAWCVEPMLEVLGQRDAGPVLWLAPSDTIVEQTRKALSKRDHPYRRELDRAFDGRVTVCDLDAALWVQKSRLESECVVIVTTMQSLRREQTSGEGTVRAYKQNGALLHHFADLTVPQREALLEGAAAEDENPLRPTLANVLRMHRPAVIVDEAHGFRSGLSFETLRRFGPLGVLELTATPTEDGNVLHKVSAATLKAERMIKLPVMLRARKHGRDAIAAAVEKRKELAEAAEAERATHGYVRPIVLYQAENKSGDLDVEEVKRVLVEELGIDAARVAIRTGDTDSLPDDILLPDCPIEHVITVQALREGWDCPFAYVLCSVANLGARTAVEQLLGRVLRMPYVRERGADELNRAYCYATSENFQAAANDLEAALVESCGFEPEEAKRIVKRSPEASDGGLFDPEANEPVSLKLEGSLDLAALPVGVREHVSVQPRREGGQILTWTGGGMNEGQEAAVAEALTSDRDRTGRAAARLRRRSWREDDAPAAMSVPFAVPAMAVREGGQWYVLEDQPEEQPWTLHPEAAEVSESEFKIGGDDSRVAAVDVNTRGGVLTSFLHDLDRQVHLFERSGRDTPGKLANWLDRHIRDRSLPASQKRPFLLACVEDLIERRGLELAPLDRHRHMLKDVLAGKIAARRLNAEREAYQHLLSSDGFGVSMDCCLRFGPSYPADRICSASYDWQKHYYGEVGAMNDAELEVAKYLDSLPQVMHWVRNLEGEHHANHAFWLRRPHGRFFPDFVAELVGERYLVVEYKGMLEGTPEEEEKRRVGEVWAAGAPSELAFVWATGNIQSWRSKIDAAVELLT